MEDPPKCEKCNNYVKTNNNDSLVLRSIYTALPCFIGTFESSCEVTVLRPELKDITQQFFIYELTSICQNYLCSPLYICMTDHYNKLNAVQIVLNSTDPSLKIVLDTTQSQNVRQTVMQLYLEAAALRRKTAVIGVQLHRRCPNSKRLVPHLLESCLHMRGINRRESFRDSSLYKLCITKVNAVYGFRRDIIHDNKNVPWTIMWDLKYGVKRCLPL